MLFLCKCVWCGAVFESHTTTAKYCPGASCKRKAIYQRHKDKELEGQRLYREKKRALRALEPPKRIGRPPNPPREHRFIDEVECTICTKCKQFLPLDCFGKRTSSPDGLRGQCKKCEFEAGKEGQKAYYEKHKGQIKKYKAEWEQEKKKDPEYRQSRKQYLAELRERPEYKERYKKWYKKYYRNPKTKERIKHQTIKRRTLKKNAIATLTTEEWQECLEYFNHKDAYTGLPMETISMEHVIPLSKGGGYTSSNIIPCENSVNKSKNDSDLFDWYPMQPFFSETRLRKILTWTGLKPNSEVQQISMF